MNLSTTPIWQEQKSLAEIKKIYGKDLTDGEFVTLCQIGQATNLNPFMREIWAVKYGNNPASIFIGRDGYRKAAQDNPDYDYHTVDSVFQNDNFSIKNGEVEHSYNIKNRGQLVGAYCSVKRKSSTRAIYIFVEVKEYYLGNKDENGKVKKGKYGDMKPTLWDTKPSTMIKKVAEAQGLRMAFQGIFSGTYDESEQWEDKTPQTPQNPTPPQNKPPVHKITPEQMKKAHALWNQVWKLLIEIRGDETDEQGEIRYTPEKSEVMRKTTLKAYYKKESSKDLTKQEAHDFILKMEEKFKLLEQEKISWESPEDQVKKLKEAIAYEQIQYDLANKNPTDTEQFRNAQRRMFEKIQKMKEELQKIKGSQIKYAVADDGPNGTWNVYNEDTAKLLKGGFSTKQEGENWVKIQQQAKSINQ